MEAMVVEEEGCTTPRRSECRIVIDATRPPPAPRKKPMVIRQHGHRDPPKDGYFQAPDLESVFTLIPRREACV